MLKQGSRDRMDHRRSRMIKKEGEGTFLGVSPKDDKEAKGKGSF